MYLVAVNLTNPREMTIVEAVDRATIRIGRKPESLPEEEVDILRISWSDRLVSRNHCEAKRSGDVVELHRLPALTGRSTPNALYSAEAPTNRQLLEEPVHLALGEGAIIGLKGSTALYWLADLADLDGALDRYRASLEATKTNFEDSDIAGQDYDEVEQLEEYSLRLQLKLLQQELPEQVLTGWNEPSELFTRASVFLENALPGQKGVSVVFLSLSRNGNPGEFTILNPDPSARADFRPSRTLLGTIKATDPNPTKVHIWSLKDNQRSITAESLGGQVDWVIALPVALLDEDAKIYRSEKGDPVFLYVETRHASETAAAAFVPFLRLIGSLVASLLSARAEQKLQDQMAAYFSPGLRRLMQREDQSLLEPAMVDCTVMFADRRGHSRMLEVAKSDEAILDRLNENQEVVGLITEEIFNNDGVVTDFAGDGALGLWGWPNIGAREEKHALDAIDAAEAIVRRLEENVLYEEQLG
ncbi:MAG: hypothetical protein AAGC68_09510, partial [Verrucomicrobiota bacterium]